MNERRYQLAIQALQLLQAAADSQGHITGSVKKILTTGDMKPYQAQRAMADLKALQALSGRGSLTTGSVVKLGVQIPRVLFEGYEKTLPASNTEIKAWLEDYLLPDGPTTWTLLDETWQFTLYPRSEPTSQDSSGVSFELRPHDKVTPELRGMLLPSGYLGAIKLHELWKAQKAFISL